MNIFENHSQWGIINYNFNRSIYYAKSKYFLILLYRFIQISDTYCNIFIVLGYTIIGCLYTCIILCLYMIPNSYSVNAYVGRNIFKC